MTSQDNHEGRGKGTSTYCEAVILTKIAQKTNGKNKSGQIVQQCFPRRERRRWRKRQVKTADLTQAFRR